MPRSKDSPAPARLNLRLPERNVGATTPDDIKIIAQFLAEYSHPHREWQDLTREAFKLRCQLKRRGNYRSE